MKEDKNKNFQPLFAGKTWLTYTLFLLIASTMSLFFTTLHFTLCKEPETVTLSSLINNSADVPFQFRVLVPWMVNFLYKLNLPFLGSPIILFKCVDFLSVFFLIIAFRSYLSLFIKNDRIVSLFSLALIFILPFNYIFYSKSFGAFLYPWDMPSILFFTIGLILIYRKNWFLYYPVFFIATFNRETTIFLTFIYFLTAIERNKITTVLFHCASQVTVWMIIKKFIAILYASNPGPGLFFCQFLNNLALLSDPLKVGILLSNFGFVWIAVVFYFRFIKDHFVKRSLLVVFPFFCGMMIVGNLTELRIYGELIPVILSAFLLILNNLFQLDIPQSSNNNKS